VRSEVHTPVRHTAFPISMEGDEVSNINVDGLEGV
jgi:hypothetical protein